MCSLLLFFAVVLVGGTGKAAGMRFPLNLEVPRPLEYWLCSLCNTEECSEYYCNRQPGESMETDEDEWRFPDVHDALCKACRTKKCRKLHCYKEAWFEKGVRIDVNQLLCEACTTDKCREKFCNKEKWQLVKVDEEGYVSLED